MLWSSCTDKKTKCWNGDAVNITNPHLWGIPSTVILLNISTHIPLLCLQPHTPPQLNHATTTRVENQQSPQLCHLHYWATPIPFHLPQCRATSAVADVIASSPDPRSDRQHLNPHSPTPTEAVTQRAGDTHGYKAPHTRRRNVPLQEKERREDESEVLQLQAKRNRDFSLVSQYMLYIIVCLNVCSVFLIKYRLRDLTIVMFKTKYKG